MEESGQPIFLREIPYVELEDKRSALVRQMEERAVLKFRREQRYIRKGKKKRKPTRKVS